MHYIIILLSFLLVGCAGQSYQVERAQYDNLETPMQTESVCFYYDVWAGMYKASVLQIITDDNPIFTIVVEYNGSGWLFLDGKIVLQTDKGLIRLQDPSPSRTVLYGGRVNERVSAVISVEELLQIAESSTLRIQFYAAPVDVSPEQISYIKRYLQENTDLYNK